jgi:hypothetical protein
VKGHPANAGQGPAAERDTSAAESRSATPRLSIILVSRESRAELERAVRVIAAVVRDLSAQLVVVRRNVEQTLSHTLTSLCRVEIVAAATDATRVEMLAMAMRAADGEVIVVRDDSAVHDAEWLAGYRRLSLAGQTSPRTDVEVPVIRGQEIDASAGRQAPGRP